MLVFMVAEKPSLAQSISKILSNNQLSSHKGFNNACSVHEWSGKFMNMQCKFKMTSVCGHVMSLDFDAKYNNWDKVDPVCGLFFYFIFISLLFEYFLLFKQVRAVQSWDIQERGHAESQNARLFRKGGQRRWLLGALARLWQRRREYLLWGCRCCSTCTE